LHALAYNLGNFMRMLAMPKAVEPSLTSLREKLIKIGAQVVNHGRYVTFQMAEVAVRGSCSGTSSCSLPASGPARTQPERCKDRMRQTTTAGVRHDEGKVTSFYARRGGNPSIPCPRHPSRLGLFAMERPKTRQWRSPVPQSEEKRS
jgi:hypothetical protein